MTRDQQVTAIAEAFAEVLRQWLTREEMEAVRSRNASQSNPGICHSHDFCDANMAMDAAFRGLSIPTCLDLDDDTKEHEEACRLWNDAWDVAKRLYLTTRV
ncbi:hypothetical protein [Bradyrhizobium sp. 150]|uniref:hypothetical protein n=1 Tax=Bradyrhizobium sp. 150 TaxID=2782625 RepID=UPI001FF74C4B|nr:hypothetical protein [Bradyrhizobium sp. 150]MCK1671087.1 hypothetical protein [Bradyrhizobium sp. 150]